jgi:hypothetical protein
MKILKLLIAGLAFSSFSAFAQEEVKKESEQTSDVKFYQESKRSFMDDWSVSLRVQNPILFGDHQGLSKYFNDNKWDIL